MPEWRLASTTVEQESAVTEGEKMVWAATYAGRYLELIESRRLYGADYDPAEAVETAYAAVTELRANEDSIAENWGEDNENVTMLREIISRGDTK